MTTYRYLAVDTSTGRILEEIPLKGVTYTVGVNTPGDMSAEIPRDAPFFLKYMDATIPLRCSIVIERDGVLVWGGVIWTRSRKKTSRTVSITGSEFLSFYSGVLFTEDRKYVQQDQLVIARALIAYAASKPGGYIGVDAFAPLALSGVLRDREYVRNDAKSVLEMLQNLTQVINGFDARIDVAYSGGVVKRRLLLGYPSLGRSAAKSGIVFEERSGLVELDIDEDAVTMATTTWAFGALSPTDTAGTNIPQTSVTDPTMTGTYGWPLRESALRYQDVYDVSTLNAHAQEAARAWRGPIVTGTVSYRGDVEPLIGTYLPGDYARVRSQDGTIDQPMQISTVSVTVSDDGADVVNVGLVMQYNIENGGSI